MARTENDGLFSFMMGLLAGLAGGAILGVLFAPKSGDETREDVSCYVSGLPDKLSAEVKNPRGKTREFIDRARYTIESQVDRVKEGVKADRQAKAKRAEELASGYESP